MTEVEVWLIRLDRVPDLAAVLDDRERERADRYTTGRARFVAAHGAVRVILGARLGVAPERIAWRYGPAGKPELVGTGGWRVNLSHSGGLAALAVTREWPVGVDVQRLTPGLDPCRMATRYFSPDEARYVAETDQTARFFTLWTRKEACVKADGGRLVPGLRIPVHPVDAGPYRIRDLPVPPGFRGAVAMRGDGYYRVIRRYWPDGEAQLYERVREW